MADSEKAVEGQQPSWSLIELSGLVAAMLVVVLLTVPFLGDHSLWFDEVFSVNVAHDWTGMYRTFSLYENNMALYYALLHIWMAIFGDSEVALRALSVLFAVATLAIVHLIARRQFDVRVAICADFLLAFSLHFLEFAQEARSYALLILLSSLTVLLFAEGVRRPRWWIWVGFSIIAAASVYAHYFGILTVASCFAAALVLDRERMPWRTFFGAGLLFAALLVPLLVVRPPNASQVDWIVNPSLKELKYFVSWMCNLSARLAIAFALCIGYGLWRFARTAPAERRRRLWPLTLLLSWMILPTALALVATFAIRPIFFPKYLLGSLPAIMLLVAVGLGQLPIRWMVPALLAMLLPFGYGYVVEGVPRNANEDWRGAAAKVASEAQAGDVSIVYPYYCALPFRYYLHRHPGFPESLDPQDLASAPYHPGGGSPLSSPDLGKLAVVTAGSPRLWVINCLSRNGKGRDLILKQLYAKYQLVQTVFTSENVQVMQFSQSLP